MQLIEFIFRNLPVLLVFMTVAAFGWIWGGARSDVLVPTIPWLYAFLFEGLLFFPQRRPYEDAPTARRRAWHALRRDPLFYVTLVLVVVLAVPFVNRGLCPSCDYAAILRSAKLTGITFEEAASPLVPHAPFCVNLEDHFGVFIWFMPALTAMLAAKHALSRQGKRILMELIVWNAAALAVFGFVQSGTGAELPYWTKPHGSASPFFSTFGYPNMAGCFFVAMTAFSIGLWQHRVAEIASLPRLDKTSSFHEQVLNRVAIAHYAVIPVALNCFGALYSLSRAAILQVVLVMVLALLYYECALLFSRIDRARHIKTAAIVLGCAVGFLAVAWVFAPKGLEREINSISDVAVADRVSGKGQYHGRVAMAIFKDHPLFGVGGWGYKHFCTSYMTKDELRGIQSQGGANVHNDYVQFLCEHGAVGAGLMALVLLLLLWPTFREWCRLYRTARFMRPDKAPPKPRAVFCMPPGAFWILVGDATIAVHALGDCPFRSAAILSAFLVSLACVEGYLPRDGGTSR